MRESVFFLENTSFKFGKRYFYKKIKLKDIEDCQSECNYWSIRDLYPEYPIEIELQKDKILFYVNAFENKESNLIFIEFSLDNPLVFTARMCNLFFTKEDLFPDSFYNIAAPLFYSDLEEYRDENITVHLFLDFLYDFFHSEVFMGHPDYSSIRGKLLKIPAVEYLYAKLEFLFYKDTIKESTYFYDKLYSWFDLLDSSEAGKVLQDGGQWFKPITEEVNEIAKTFNRQMLKNKQFTELEHRIFQWQVANTQILEVIENNKSQSKKIISNNNQDTKKNKQTLKKITNVFKRNTILLISLIPLLPIFGSLFFNINIPIIILSVSFLLILFYVVFILIIFGKSVKKLLSILNFELFFVSIAVWGWIDFSDNYFYFQPDTYKFIFLFILLILSALALLNYIKHLSWRNAIYITSVAVLVSFIIGVITVSLSKPEIPNNVNQILILQNKLPDSYFRIIQDTDSLKDNAFYSFEFRDDTDTFKIFNKKIFPDSKIAENTINLNSKDSLFAVDTTKYYLLQDSVLTKVVKDCVLNESKKILSYQKLKVIKIIINFYPFSILYFSENLIFWSLISAIAGLWVFMWGRAKMEVNTN